MYRKERHIKIGGLTAILSRLCLIVALFLFPFRAFSQINAEQVTAIGRNVLSMEDYLLAIQYFNQAIKAKPHLAAPYYLRGLAKLQLEDFKGAEQDCSKAIEINKFYSEAYRLRGFARQRMGLDSLAILDYNVGLQYNPTDREFLFYKAIAETELQRYDTADETLGQLIRSNPSFYEGVTARGYLRMQRGDTVGALDDIEQSIKLSKAQIQPYIMKAEIFSNRQQWKPAIEAMDEIIRQQPDNTDLYLNRAFLRYRDDDYYGAMADYNSAVELDPYNSAALFNRALLRFEVFELDQAAADFTKVLDLDRNNFHALYNRALVYINMGDYAKAEPDIKTILAKYPKFYPAYYALAQCRQAVGDEKGAIRNMMTADDMIRKYVADPEKYPLDRPTIADVSNNRTEGETEESEEEVMEKFNQLVTKSQVKENGLSFNDKIRGKVQNRDTDLEPEPMYSLSFTAPSKSLRSLSNYFKELSEVNSKNYIPEKLYLVSETASADEKEVDKTFDTADRYTQLLASGKGRAIDYMARGVAYSMLKNFDSAIADFDTALGLMPDFTVALMGKGYAMTQKYLLDTGVPEGADRTAINELREREAAAIIDVYDKALSLNPSLVYAWYNKGNLYMALRDYAEAIRCFTKAVELDPELGAAYYNRGLSQLSTGRKQPAFDDFRKAGELGILQSYRVMKRMQ